MPGRSKIRWRSQTGPSFVRPYCLQPNICYVPDDYRKKCNKFLVYDINWRGVIKWHSTLTGDVVLWNDIEPNFITIKSALLLELINSHNWILPSYPFGALQLINRLLRHLCFIQFVLLSDHTNHRVNIITFTLHQTQMFDLKNLICGKCNKYYIFCTLRRTFFPISVEFAL